MSAIEIEFTRGPVRAVASGSQPLTQAVDLGGQYRVLDLTLNVYGVSGTSPSLTVAVYTSMQNELELPWAQLGNSFTAVTAADQSQRAVLVGALRYVRYVVTVSGTSPVLYFSLDGFARTTE